MKHLFYCLFLKKLIQKILFHLNLKNQNLHFPIHNLTFLNSS